MRAAFFHEVLLHPLLVIYVFVPENKLKAGFHQSIGTSENSRDINITKSRNIRRTNPFICLVLFSLITCSHKHKLKHKKTKKENVERVTSENSTRQISGFVPLVFLFMLMSMSWLFSLVLML